MLSWRYLGHPQGGGAEVLTHEILRRCVAAGWPVTAFTAAFPGSTPTDEIDGVQIVRGGAQHSVHYHAWRWLRTRRSEFDRVVDQVNTIAFMTPLYVPADVRRMFICQFAKEYWFRETRGLFRLGAPVGYVLEPWQTRLYRSTPAVTISESTRDELEALGVPVAGIIPMAIHTTPVAALERREGPLRLIIVGRLTPAKFVEEGIQAFAAVQQHAPDAQLDIVGDGDPAYRARLDALVAGRDLRGVTFHGRVPETRKAELLQRAHFHIFTSHREGWGLTVTEAAAAGTPTVAYDVPGVRDSVQDRKLLAPRGDHGALAKRVLELDADRATYDALRTTAWERARALSWDETARRFMELVA
jgi:glycosyltransferase involved in cell wall biosynthesis